MWIIAAFIGGSILGCIISILILRLRVIGYLRVDQSDPYDEPYLFLELFRRVPNLCAKKYVVLKVKVENFISHK